jgi:hypothetical protein
MPKNERLALAAFSLLSLVLRAAAFFRYRFDSDEPQHLHVAWGWTAGLVQYRDVFDNHAPLFHMLTAPLLARAGERPDILFFMRLPMLPLWIIVVWATYIIGKRVASASVGLWAAVLLSLFPPFFLKSLEYRTDNLWTALWMLALFVITGGDLTALRLFIAGLLIGAALCVSLKTSLLIITLGAAGIITYLFAMNGRSMARMIRVAIPFVIGATIIPAMIVIYFCAIDAWRPFVYCVFEFNEAVTRTRSPLMLWWPRIAYIPFITLAIIAARQRRNNRNTLAARWRYFLGVSLAVFCITLVAFWILISPRDLLPMMPIMAIFLVARAERRSLRAITGTAACVLFIPFLFGYTHGFRNETRENVTMMNQVLRLTRPGEPLMDFKGETVYRRRPYYYILEYISRHQMQAGMIKDTIAADVVRTRCHVAQADGDFLPPAGRAFLSANFLDMGRLRAAGQIIQPDGTFTIAIPGDYIIVDEKGAAAGTLDGTPANVRTLAAGTHRFIGGAERTAVLWAPAFARGFSPFHLRDREF